MSRANKLIVLHCSATPDESKLFRGIASRPGFVTPVDEIDIWHRERGFMRSSYWRGRQNGYLTSIGYHYVVARNGALFTGRHVDEPGAHAKGWNAESIGVCLVGEARYTATQWAMLREHIELLARHHHIPLAPPELKVVDGKRGIVARPGICGHRDLPGHAKACPGFDVAAWLAGGRQPLPEHLA